MVLREKAHIILFDLDGTLVDSTQAIYASFCESFKAMGQIPPSFESVKQYIGHTLEDMFLAHNVSSLQVESYVQHYRNCYRKLMEEGTHLLPYVKDALKRAYEFASLGVVTTKRGDFSRILLENLGVWKYFDGIVGIESVKYPKPHAELILKALDLLQAQQKGISKNRIYMVGDTMLDIQAAQNTGIKAVGVLCGFGIEADMRASNVPLYANPLMAVDYIAQKCSI